MRVENSFLNIESKQSKNSSLNTQGDFQKVLDDSNPLIKKSRQCVCSKYNWRNGRGFFCECVYVSCC